MIRSTLTAIAVLSLATASVGALAAPCRDAKGKFIKCAPPAPAKKAACRDAKGHFAKCGAPGAK